MVLVEVISEEPLPPSDERLLDAKEIEEAAAKLERPGARMQLESLAKKLRKEAAALKRVEQSQKTASAASTETETTTTTSSSPPETPKKTPAPAPTPAPTPVKVAAVPLPAPSAASSVKYTPVDRFSFDPGEYESKFVTIYVPLPGVGSIPKDQINCQFTKDSFDLIVTDLKGKSYRLFKDSLEKDINVEKSKKIIKADKVVIKLHKVKGDYGFDMWTKLTDPKKHDKKKKSKSSNPMSSITDMMKDMYDSGDDEMRKMIGETMLKQRNGELEQNTIGGMDPGMGGMGGMDDFGDFKDDMP
mmetsp:Transcript_12428/g.29586  ORF Transcript_12428/g.29586 Transcript_12428/m.29586 type:complete len:301 (-) Transcript_12428:63-965(-)